MRSATGRRNVPRCATIKSCSWIRRRQLPDSTEDRSQRGSGEAVGFSVRRADEREDSGRVPPLPHPVVMPTPGFVFLEITQPEIRSLLWRMQCILSGTQPRHPVHVTLRGPYAGRIAQERLERVRQVLCKDTLRIGGVGRFRKPEEVVFLRVDSPNLRKVCWKRNYPKKDGHEPHISLYRGSDAAFADRAADFLTREALEFSCTEYKLWIHRRESFRLESGADRVADLGDASVFVRKPAA